MKVISKNDLMTVLTGDQKRQPILHSHNAIDSRASLTRDLLTMAMQAEVHFSGGAPALAAYVCELSEALHKEWDKRGWVVAMPSADDLFSGDEVGFKR